jgi:high-affinity Fe2+/Pb2+ permease
MCRQVATASRQSLVDLVVALASVPLLVVFGLMLEINMRGDWTSDSNMRWNVIVLGLALLAISLMVCGYVTHRLGLCIWAATQESFSQRSGSNVSPVSLH